MISALILVLAYLEGQLLRVVEAPGASAREA